MSNQIRKIRESAGKTQADAAAVLDITTENYNRLENGKTQITLSKLEKLAEFFHRQPSELIASHGNVRTVRVRQHVQAGEWAESLLWEEDDCYDVIVPNDPEFQNVMLYGAETRGPSMNKRYTEGAAVIYTDIIETGESPVPGRRYIVERERADGMREATVKTLFKDDDGKFWLLPESTDPRHQTPIDLSGGDGDIVRIVGRVAFSVQRES
ncbi:phage repressor [Rhizobium sp. Leaf155]|nr:phage repressor [Rhizobium sp. Leaf155]